MKIGTETYWKTLGVASLAALLFVAADISAPGGLGVAPVWAQSDDQGSRRKTKQVKAASRHVYEKLTEGQELMEAEKFNEALGLMKETSQMDDLSSYDRVLINQMFGYIYSSLENYPAAIRYFERMLREEDIPEGLSQSTQYNLGQLYLITEEYGKSIETLQDWFDTAENPGPQAYMLMAQAHIQMDDFESALPWAEKGMSLARKKNKQQAQEAVDNPEVEDPGPIRESWYQLLLALYFDQEMYDEARKTVEELLHIYPKRDYWLQLAAVFYQEKNEWDQLGAMEAAYRQDLLVQSTEYENLAQLYMFHGIPIKATWVLEKGMQEGTVEKDKDNWELLANAYYNSRETEKSIAPLRRAAKLSEDGELFVRLGQSHMNLQEWEKAATAFRNAINKGDLNQPGQANLLLGMARFNGDNLESAREAFRSAQQYDGTKQSAARWLNYIEQEEKRRSLR